jgi:hypothetical protein
VAYCAAAVAWGQIDMKSGEKLWLAGQLRLMIGELPLGSVLV